MALSYTSVNRMKSRVTAISSRTSVSSADLFTIAEDAESEVNARLAKLYTVPVAGTVPILQTISTEIAAQKYLAQRAFTGERNNDSPWPKSFDRAWTTLDEIAEGKIPLVNNSGDLIATNDTRVEMWSNTKDYQPTFTEDDMNLQWVDGEKIDDIRDARDD